MIEIEFPSIEFGKLVPVIVYTSFPCGLADVGEFPVTVKPTTYSAKAASLGILPLAVTTLGYQLPAVGACNNVHVI